MRKLIFGVIVFMVVGTLKAEINFFQGTLANALQKAGKEQRAVMIDFITDWCRWCDTLDARTYSDASVAAFVNERLVPIKIDAEKGEGIEIAKKYGVRAFPTIVVVKPDGEEIDRILGYVEAGPFLATLQDYVRGENTIGVLLARVKEHPDDAVTRYALARKYGDRNEMGAAGTQYQKLLELDPENTLGHAEEANFAVALSTLRADKDPSPMATFLESFPQSERRREALSLLWRFYIREKDGTQGKKYFVQYIETWPADAGVMNNYAWTCAENKVNLDHAEEVIERAVALASGNREKASFIDTHAAVAFARGNLDAAVALEEQALELAKAVPNAKLTPYEEALAKFRSATKPKSNP
jgi:thioredoxin-related protein